MESTLTPKNENSNLDFLRTVAVLSVFSGHTLHYFGLHKTGPLDLMVLGNLGVLIFFVHTCLVLMLSLERQQKTQGNNKLFLSFMIRRCFRIYPLSMAAILIVTIFGLPMVEINTASFSGWHADFGDILSNLFLVQNLSFRVSLLGPTWSLCYEMEMYLLLPLLFVWITIKRAWWLIPALFVTVVVTNRLVNYSTPNLLIWTPCFLAGIMAFLVQKKVTPRIPSWLWPVFIVGLVTAYMLTKPCSYRRPLVSLVLGLAIPFFTSITNRPLVAAGKLVAKYSYGVYLSHPFCIWFAFQKLGSLPMSLQIPIFFTIAVLLPIILYHAIEDPCLKFGKRISDLKPRLGV